MSHSRVADRRHVPDAHGQVHRLRRLDHVLRAWALTVVDSDQRVRILGHHCGVTIGAMAEHETTKVTDRVDEVIDRLNRIDESDWGPWKLNRVSRKLYVEAPSYYALDLADIAAPSLLDTLRHMAHKTWMTNEYLGGLVRAALALENAPGDVLWQRAK